MDSHTAASTPHPSGGLWSPWNKLGRWGEGPVVKHTLLSSFFMVTRSRDLREWPVGVMK